MHLWRVMSSCTVMAVCSLPMTASAQPAGAETALAEALYQKARQLMADGNYAEACPKFAASYRLDPATGTLLNLAACHEAQHKLATAWLELTEAVAAAKRDHRDDRVTFAEEHLAAIEPKLSRLAIVVATTADVPDLKVQLDGVEVLPAARGVPAPVDPGEHLVEAAAPGKKTWSQRIVIDEHGQTLTISVPALEPEAPPAPTAPSAQPLSPTPPTPEAAKRPVPASAYIAGISTLGLVVGASVTGVVYLSHRSSEGKVQPADEFDRNKRWGTVNLILIAGALAGSGVTAYFYLTRPSHPSAAASVAVSPWVGPAGAGLSIGGSL